MKTRRIRITVNTIRTAKVGASDSFLWDSDARGLGLKISPTGAKRWVFQYHLNGRNRRITLGDATSISPHDAREEALQLYAAVRLKSCPATKKKATRSAPAMGDLFNRFMDEHSKVRNKPSTVRVNEGRIKTNLRPFFAKYQVDEVTSEHIEAFRATLGNKHTTFNRCLSLLRKAFNLAKKWKLRLDNPCDDVEGYVETRGTRVLSDNELQRVAKGLNVIQAERTAKGRLTSAVDALRLTACQGFRISEPRTCKWDEIDWDQSLLKLEDSKTGKKNVPIGPVSLLVLKDIKKRQEEAGITSPFVCPSPDDHGKAISYTSVKKALDEITECYGIKDATSHTFRRTSATTIAARSNDVFGLRDAFGWKSLAMPNHYVGLAQVNAKRVVSLQTEYLPSELLPAPSEDDATTPTSVAHDSAKAP